MSTSMGTIVFISSYIQWLSFKSYGMHTKEKPYTAGGLLLTANVYGGGAVITQFKESDD